MRIIDQQQSAGLPIRILRIFVDPCMDIADGTRGIVANRENDEFVPRLDFVFFGKRDRPQIDKGIRGWSVLRLSRVWAGKKA